MKKDEKPYHILVIEDNLGDFVILEEYLSESILHLEATHAENFKEAVELLEKNERQYDLVFLDLSLPDKSGEELVKEITGRAEEIPVVVLTGFADLEFGSRSLALGASDYLVKDDLSPAVLYKSLIYNIQRVNFISELKDSKKKYADLFQLNPSPILVYDFETLKILDVNEASVQKYGYSREEFLNMDLKDLRPKEDEAILISAVEEFWKKNGKNYKKISRHLKKNGELMDVERSPAKIKINNKDAGMVLINDITENLKYIHKIEEQNQTFKEIAWIQSHVVRAPLARLMGLVNLLEGSEDNLSEDNQKLVEYIKLSAEELDAIIRDISKKSEGIYNES